MRIMVSIFRFSCTGHEVQVHGMSRILVLGSWDLSSIFELDSYIIGNDKLDVFYIKQ